MKYYFTILYLILYACTSFGQQGISAKYLNLVPSTLPSLCSVGMIRTNSSTNVPNYCSATNTWTAIGSGGGAAAWGSITGTLSSQTDLQTALNAKLPVTITTTGDIIYSSSGTTASRLGIGSSTNLLTVSGGVPAWESIPTWNQNTTGNAATATSATTATNIAGGASGSIPYQTGSATTSLLATASGVLIGGTPPSYTTTPTLAGIKDTSNVLNIEDSTDTTKIIALNASGNNTGKTLTISSAQSLSETLSVPNITGADTIDTLGLAQTISGAKTFSSAPIIGSIIDSSNVLNIEDSTTNSKVLAFNVSGNTSAVTTTLKPTSSTSQIIQLPNVTATDTLASLGLAQTFSATQTFTNAPTFSSVTSSQLLNVNGSKSLTSIAYSTTPAASSMLELDTNKNANANSFIPLSQSIATAAGTTALTVSSPMYTDFTGSTTQTVTLPAASTLALGTPYVIANNSTGVVTVQSSGANTVQAMAAGTIGYFVNNVITGTGAAVWNDLYSGGTPTFSGLTQYGAMYASTTTAIASTAVGTTGQILTATTSAAPAFAAPVTNNYFNGFMASTSAGWTTTSTTFATPTGGTNTLTTRKSNGITVTAGTGPQITFTPAASTSVYWVSVTFTSFIGVSISAFYQITDGTNVIDTGSNQTGLNGTPITLQGVYVPGTGSAISITIQAATANGADSVGIINGTASLNNAIEWQVVQIK